MQVQRVLNKRFEASELKAESKRHKEMGLEWNVK